MNAGDAIGRAREALIEFDVDLAADAELYKELHDAQEEILEAIVLQDNSGYPLPGDVCIEMTGLATLAPPWALPSDYWRPRRFIALYTGGRKAPVQIVLEQQFEGRIPAIWPSAFMRKKALYPIEGFKGADGANRKYGWKDLDKIELYYVKRPAVPAALTDVLGAPDDAADWLGYRLAAFMAARAKVGHAIQQELSQRRDRAREQLLAATLIYPDGGLRAFANG